MTESVIRKEYGMFIGGEFVPSSSGNVFSSINPANQDKACGYCLSK